MNFLVTSMTGYRNKGCEALSKSIVYEIKKLQENAKFKIFTEDIDYDKLWASGTEDVTFLVTPFGKQYLVGGRSFFPKWWQCKLIGMSPISSSIKRGMDAFNQVDAVLSTGGDVFSSTYGNLERHLSPIKIAASYGKPAFLVGHSVGPFEKPSEYKLFAKNMRHVQLITARESLSFKYLKDMKLKHSKIELTADPAFCLEPNMKNIKRLLEIYQITKEKPVIGVVPSQGIANFSGICYESHVNNLLTFLKFLISKLDCHVVLLPHVHQNSVNNDDRVLCEMLNRKLDFPENITVTSLAHSAEEIRALVSTFDFMITERMHAAIAALAQNVPTFVVGYSVKAKGILGDIFGFDSLNDYLVSVKKLEAKKLIECTTNLFYRRNEVSKYLSKVMPRIKENARRNFTLISDCMEQ